MNNGSETAKAVDDFTIVTTNGMNEVFDFIIIGSGFGGSVSAMRLAQKGYSVLVLERGKRFTAKDFPKTNWNIFKYLWLPGLRCFGIQGLNFFKDIWLLNGSALLLLKLFGITPTGHQHTHSPAEIEILLNESRLGGTLSDAAHRRLRVTPRDQRQRSRGDDRARGA